MRPPPSCAFGFSKCGFSVADHDTPPLLQRRTVTRLFPFPRWGQFPSRGSVLGAFEIGGRLRQRRQKLYPLESNSYIHALAVFPHTSPHSEVTMINRGCVPQPRPAFTLVELLVVIAIIGV